MSKPGLYEKLCAWFDGTKIVCLEMCDGEVIYRHAHMTPLGYWVCYLLPTIKTDPVRLENNGAVKCGKYLGQPLVLRWCWLDGSNKTGNERPSNEPR